MGHRFPSQGAGRRFAERFRGHLAEIGDIHDSRKLSWLLVLNLIEHGGEIDFLVFVEDGSLSGTNAKLINYWGNPTAYRR